MRALDTCLCPKTPPSELRFWTLLVGPGRAFGERGHRRVQDFEAYYAYNQEPNAHFGADGREDRFKGPHSKGGRWRLGELANLPCPAEEGRERERERERMAPYAWEKKRENERAKEIAKEGERESVQG